MISCRVCLLMRNAQPWKVYTQSMSESWNSPPLFCCCGSWDGVSTRRLCPMIQPLRGLYLSCTQKRAQNPGQISSCTCLPPSCPLISPVSGLFFLPVFLSSTLSLRLSLQSSLPLTISLRPSLPAGAGLPLPLAHWPSLLGSQHRSAFTERCLPFLGEGRVMFLIWCVCCGMQCNVYIP